MFSNTKPFRTFHRVRGVRPDNTLMRTLAARAVLPVLTALAVCVPSGAAHAATVDKATWDAQVQAAAMTVLVPVPGTATVVREFTLDSGGTRTSSRTDTWNPNGAYLSVTEKQGATSTLLCTPKKECFQKDSAGRWRIAKGVTPPPAPGTDPAAFMFSVGLDPAARYDVSGSTFAATQTGRSVTVKATPGKVLAYDIDTTPAGGRIVTEIRTGQKPVLVKKPTKKELR